MFTKSLNMNKSCNFIIEGLSFSNVKRKMRKVILGQWPVRGLGQWPLFWDSGWVGAFGTVATFLGQWPVFWDSGLQAVVWLGQVRLG